MKQLVPWPPLLLILQRDIKGSLVLWLMGIIAIIRCRCRVLPFHGKWFRPISLPGLFESRMISPFRNLPGRNISCPPCFSSPLVLRENSSPFPAGPLSDVVVPVLRECAFVLVACLCARARSVPLLPAWLPVKSLAREPPPFASFPQAFPVTSRSNVLWVLGISLRSDLASDCDLEHLSLSPY